MPIFVYNASDSDGKIVDGERIASNEKEVMDYLAKKELIPLQVWKKQKKKKLSLSSPLSSDITTVDKILFIRRFSSMLKAGLGIEKIFKILVEGTKKKSMRKFLSEVEESVKRGQPLYVIFESHEELFSPVFVGLIKAGEATGNLDKVLDQLADSLNREYEVQNKIKSASFYPIILLFTATLILTGIFVFVMPKLVNAFEQSGIELPLATVILIAISVFFKKYIVFLLIGLIGFIIFFFIFKKTASGKKYLAMAVDYVPVINKLSRANSLARFSRTFSMLLASGTPITETLDVVADAMGNEIYKNIVLKCKEITVKGIPLSSTLKAYPKYFPTLLTGMMAAGEESGNLEHMLENTTTFYEDELDGKLKRLTSTLEPFLIAFMGALVGFIAISILLPIYTLIGKF